MRIGLAEWGSGGPEFKSRRPDQFPPRKSLKKNNLDDPIRSFRNSEGSNF